MRRLRYLESRFNFVPHSVAFKKGGGGGGGVTYPNLPSNITGAANALAAAGLGNLNSFLATDPSIQGLINSYLGSTNAPTPTTSPSTATAGGGGSSSPSPSSAPSKGGTAGASLSSFLPSSFAPAPTAGGGGTTTSTEIKKPVTPMNLQGGTNVPTSTGGQITAPFFTGQPITTSTGQSINPADLISAGLAQAGSASSGLPSVAMPKAIDFTQFQAGLNKAIDLQTQAQKNQMNSFYASAGLGNSSMAVAAGQSIDDNNLVMKSELGMQLAKLNFDEQAQIAGLSIQEQQVQLAGMLGQEKLGLDKATLGANLMQMQQNMGLQLGQFGLQVAQFKTGLNQINLSNALAEIGLASDIYNHQAANSIANNAQAQQGLASAGLGIGMLGAAVPGIAGLFSTGTTAVGAAGIGTLAAASGFSAGDLGVSALLGGLVL